MTETPFFRTMLTELTKDHRKVAAHGLNNEEVERLTGHWPEWAHAGQLPPTGDWRTWVIMAGRGFGKTRAGAEWIAEAARQNGDLRIALVAATWEEARQIMVEGQSGLLNVASDDIESWKPGPRVLRFTSGAEATVYSGATPDGLRGPEHHLAWCDELAKWQHPQETWDVLQLGLRLGDRPRTLVTTTPRSGETLRRIMDSPGCVTTGGATTANPHLPPAFVEAVTAMYAGTRLGRQELCGELLTDTPGGLWTIELIERCRTPPEGRPPAFARVAIGVDPPSGDGTCGIVACAIDANGTGHVLADHSVTGRSPAQWARAVAAAAEVHRADLIVAESNMGGEMVQAVLRAADPTAPVKLAHAAHGKSRRADPIAAQFERGAVRLHGRFPHLEAELCGLIAGGGYDGPGGSPDRADAMVWALTELMLTPPPRPEPRVIHW